MHSKYISIIDFGMGNLSSVYRACKAVGVPSIVTYDKDVIKKSSGIILPGVGAFGNAMRNLEALDLTDIIRSKIETGTPFMGICLGFQLLFSKSYEFGQHSGLDVFKGEVVRFEQPISSNAKMKVPQVQWNTVYQKENKSWGNSFLEGIPNNSYFYFVHSFYVKPTDSLLPLSYTTYYDVNFCSSIQYENVFACQFHPEKSGIYGLNIYNTFKKSAIL